MEKPNFRIFRESLETRRAGRPVRVVEDAPRSKGTDIEKEVATLIKALQGKDETIVDTAIVIYELLGIDHPSEELIKKVGDILEGNFPSIYDPDLRDAMFELLDGFDGWERTSEASAPAEPVHERLGEFRKGKEGRRHVVREEKPVQPVREGRKPIGEDSNGLRHYSVPVVWEMMGRVTVDGTSVEDAADYVSEHIDEFELPEGEYVDDSFKLAFEGDDLEDIYEIKPVREGRKPSVIHDFLDDEEKMADFRKLSKEEFLKMYSYLSEEEYDATVKALAERRRK